MDNHLLTVKQVCERTGVSARTLHHYDALGLLPPAEVSRCGYRLYDANSLKRLRLILLYREIELPLKEIKRILDEPMFDERAALICQKEYLSIKQNRLCKLISLVDALIKEDETMSFSAFDKHELDMLRDEAKRRWGNTDAYREFERRNPQNEQADDAAVDGELMGIFKELGALKRGGFAPHDAAVQACVSALQAHISSKYYRCTDEILLSLGKMYVCDERFKANIDAYGGDGTAEFTDKAIGAYLKRA